MSELEDALSSRRLGLRRGRTYLPAVEDDLRLHGLIGRELEEDLQGAVGWERKHPEPESPPSGAATHPAVQAHIGLGRDTLVVFRKVATTSWTPATFSSVSEAHAGVHHLYPGPTKLRKSLLCRAGVQMDRTCIVNPFGYAVKRIERCHCVVVA